MTPALVHPQNILFTLFAIGTFSAYAQAPKQPPANPQQLVREMVANELKAAKEDQSHWMYQSRDDASDARETREVVESKDGVIYRVIGVWGKPLSDEQQKQEDRRIQRLLTNPFEQRRQQVARDQDAKKAKEMLEMLPSAFAYTFDSEDEDTVNLSFKPNPDFDPPTRETKVFHSMEGNLLIDRHQKRLRQLSGRLASDVEFGGGFLGRLKKGGTFEVQQTDVGGGHWQPVLTDVHITGRALFFKTIREQQHEVCSNYRRVPDNLSLAQAAELLTKNSSTSALSSALKPAP